MLNLVIIAAALILLAGLLYHEKKGPSQLRLMNKAFLSLVFIYAALAQTPQSTGYFHAIMAGLVFCLFGDVLLALTSPQAFKLGLVSFLLGHVFYIAAFSAITPYTAWSAPAVILVFAVSTYVYWRFRPHLGDMKYPVLAYIVVITVMLSAASALVMVPDLRFKGQIMAFVGAASFYFSDVFVARDRFIGQDYINRLIGLPLYYAGQFLLAFSVGAIGGLNPF